MILLSPIDLISMGRHREWRKIAKRERRRRIRTQKAKQLEGLMELTSDEQTSYLEEQKMLYKLEYEHIERNNQEENEKWMRAEKIAIEQWQKLLAQKEIMLQKKIEQEAKLKQEWELEQKKKKDEEERLKKIEEENLKRQQIFMKHLEQFLLGDSVEPPPELLTSKDTRPGAEPCPFFSKTACCRFGDQCSRNHQYPGISKVLLANNFYTHFGLENANFNEYDTDLMLEYEDNDTYKDFKDFFFDVLPEFEKFGRVIQFKVCNNFERHLRGNTYIEFLELRCAVAAYKAMHARWYGGKQVSLQFCNINSWKTAICGLQSRKRCPKGRACNFLHVFRNPNNLFNNYNNYQSQESPRTRRSPSRSWRWSESPENDGIRETHNSRRSESRIRKHKDERGHRRKHRSERTSTRRRSRSSERRNKRTS